MNGIGFIWNLGWLALAATSAFLLYFLSERLLNVIPLSDPARSRARRIRPVLGLGLLFAFSLAFAKTLFRGDALTQSLALLFVVAAFAFASQRLLRDYFAGVAIVAEESCRLGDQVRVLGTVGRVVELGVRSLTIEGQEGDKVVVPYSKLLTEPIIRIHAVEGGAVPHTFAVEQPERPLREVQRMVERVTQAHHFAALARSPELELRGGQLDITVYAIDKAYVLEMEGVVRRALESE